MDGRAQISVRDAILVLLVFVLLLVTGILIFANAPTPDVGATVAPTATASALPV